MAGGVYLRPYRMMTQVDVGGRCRQGSPVMVGDTYSFPHSLPTHKTANHLNASLSSLSHT